MHRTNNPAPLERDSSSKGQSLLELALLLPVLVLILSAALDLARVYDAYLSITNASREGARYAAAHPKVTDTPGVVNAINRELTNTGITGVTSSVGCFTYSSNSTISCDVADSGDRIKVTVGFRFNFIAFLIIGLDSVPISASTTMAITI